jgi:2-amino-4-hydroxy-6-hydroxymethyldihydropteridine diphosphokinase
LRQSLALIGLGSNLAHPRRQLARAAAALARLPATRLVALSRNYLTAPVACDLPQPDYVNAVAAVSTSLAPRALLHRLQAIERSQRRVRIAGAPRNLPRTIDLDLLLYGRCCLRLAHLVVPHPRMHERAFVLRPLLDVAPTARVPGRGLARRLLRDVRDQRIVPTRVHVLR